MGAKTPSHGGVRSPHASSAAPLAPLLSRPLLCLLLVLASGALALCLIQVQTLRTGGLASQGSDKATTPSTDRLLLGSSSLQQRPRSAFRPIQHIADAINPHTDTHTDTHTDADSNDDGSTPVSAGGGQDPWVSPLSSVHEWPPTTRTTSTYRWKSHHTPLWQMVVEPKGQTVDFAAVAIRKGRLIFYGLTDPQKAELRAHFEPFMHFDGIDARLDKVDDVTEFVDDPLDWSTCGAVQPNYSFFVTPWMPMLYYHVVCEHLINGYANMRSANALQQSLMSTFQSPALASSHPRSLFHDPLPPFHSSPATLSPFTSAHLDNDSHSALYVFTRWKGMQDSKAIQLLYHMHGNQWAEFSSLESDTLTCFRRIRWGRGVPLHYFARVFPFPLPANAPVWSSTLDTYTPAAAKQLAKDNLDLYTDIELGRWAGVMIDMHNFIMHTQGRERRVREKRDTNTHQPLPDSEVVPAASPRILLITRGPQQGRFIANRECLITAFAAASLTLTPCCDWDGPIANVIAEFQTADILVGLHGAGFTNLLWMAPGGVVIEIKTHYDPDNNYFRPLSSHMDHSHRLVDGREHHKGAQGYQFTDEWCRELAGIAQFEWRQKHSSKGRFSNVYGTGNSSASWMRKETEQEVMKRIARR